MEAKREWSLFLLNEMTFKRHSKSTLLFFSLFSLRMGREKKRRIDLSLVPPKRIENEQIMNERIEWVICDWTMKCGSTTSPATTQLSLFAALPSADKEWSWMGCGAELICLFFFRQLKWIYWRVMGGSSRTATSQERRLAHATTATPKEEAKQIYLWNCEWSEQWSKWIVGLASSLVCCGLCQRSCPLPQKDIPLHKLNPFVSFHSFFAINLSYAVAQERRQAAQLIQLYLIQLSLLFLN